MSYTRAIAVEFNHCDPAGIVFYPRYFEMTNSVVENFFAERLDYSYARITMEEGCGVPTAHLEVDFKAPSRLGDRLDFRLDVERVGTKSVCFGLTASGGSEARMAAKLVLVWVGADGRAAPWPETLRKGLLASMTEEGPSQ